MGIFVAIRPSPESKDQLYDFVKSQVIPQNFPKDKYHITLAYSKEGFDYKPDGFILNGIEVCPMGWEVFGDEEKVLVLKVVHPSLQKRAEQLAANGYRSKYPQYRAHITVGLADGVEIHNLPIPDFNITLDKEYSRPLDDNYQYSPKKMVEERFPTFLEFLVEKRN